MRFSVAMGSFPYGVGLMRPNPDPRTYGVASYGYFAQTSHAMSDIVSRLNAALEGRYRIERELAAVVGAERFLAEASTRRTGRASSTAISSPPTSCSRTENR